MATRTGSAVEIRMSSVDEMRKHGQALFDEHKAELEPGFPKLDPNWQGYYELELRHLLQILTAWDEDELVGYSICVLLPHLHYQDVLYAQHDILFVRKGYRRGTLGTRLISETEAAARERGAYCVMMHAKPGTTLEKLLPKLGYQTEETHFVKEL
jgi:GNAT superfamily N-acetyltransferase